MHESGAGHGLVPAKAGGGGIPGALSGMGQLKLDV